MRGPSDGSVGTMNKYEVVYVHVVERTITEVILASSPEEAIEKSRMGDWLESDEDLAPEQGIETKDYEVTLLEDEE